MGYEVFMDSNGDAEGNYSIVGLRCNHQKDTYDCNRKISNQNHPWSNSYHDNCSFPLANDLGLHLLGRFKQSDHLLPDLQIVEDMVWPWPFNKPPVSVPQCGFQVEPLFNCNPDSISIVKFKQLLQGELCLQTYAAGEIIMGVVGGIAVVLSVVIILAYRNYRYEQELDSLLWKVESHEIKVLVTEFNTLFEFKFIYI